MAAGIEPGGVRLATASWVACCSIVLTGAGDAVQPAEQHDLAGQVVDLDRQATRQALPRRRTGPGLRVDGDDAQDVAAPRAVLGPADVVDPGGVEHRLALALGQAGELVEVVAARAQGVDRVGEVEQQLGVLPPGDVRAGQRLEARARNAAATASVTSSTPPGQRPTSRIAAASWV